MISVVDRLFAVVVAIAPLLGLVAPLGLAPLSVLGTILSVGGVRRRVRPDGWLLVFLVMLGAWGLLGTWWALEPWQTAQTTFRLLAMLGLAFFAVACLRHLEKRSPAFMMVMAAGVLVCLPLLAWEYLSDRGFSFFMLDMRGLPMQLVGNKSPLSRGATVLSVLMWPICYALWRQRRPGWGIGLLAVSAAVMLGGDSGSSKQALIAGCLVASLALLLPVNRLYAIVRFGLLAIVLLAPFLIKMLPDPHYTYQNWTWLPGSSHHRMTIWTFTTDHIFQHPLRGWAIDASRAIPGADDEIPFRRVDAEGQMIAGQLEAQLPLHPHNSVLQWWLELGLVGVLLVIGLLWRLLDLMKGTTNDRLAHAAMLASFCTVCSISLTSYGAWQGWWHGAIVMVALSWSLLLPRKT